MTVVVRLKRSHFALLIGVVNAGMVYLVPQIPSVPLQGFAAAVLNVLIIYLATEEKKAPVNGGE